MQIILSQKAEDDLAFLRKSGNITALRKINKLIQSIEFNPFEGVGKPESLRFDLAGKWSRRISSKDRLVYEMQEQKMIVHSFLGHYEK
jgi:toxin YoeB